MRKEAPSSAIPRHCCRLGRLCTRVLRAFDPSSCQAAIVALGLALVELAAPPGHSRDSSHRPDGCGVSVTQGSPHLGNLSQEPQAQEADGLT